jgi:hypothetical protein
MDLFEISYEGLEEEKLLENLEDEVDPGECDDDCANCNGCGQ